MAFHHHHNHNTNLPQEMAFHQNPFTDQPSLSATGEDDGVGAPTWLNSSVFRQQNLLHLLAESEPRNDDVLGASEGSSKMSDFIGDRRNRRDEVEVEVEEEEVEVEVEEDDEESAEGPWYKADILRHPLYDQLLSAHVSCLRIATPVDQLPRIDEQLSQSQRVVSKYSDLGVRVVDEKELDQFMTNYVILLCSLKEQLQQHVRVHAMEAVMACWELEQSLQSLTGVSPGEGTGATMSDDNEDQVDSDVNLYDGSLDGPDSMGFGPLVPTETERSLMERVREELKQELKQGYKEKIVDIREEILRKRKAGKLPGGTTSLLKAWWQSHSKWPYPTEEDKAKLVQETGLQLKQINNWFINQRKRNWHNNMSPVPSSKSKRKR
ncbi:Knotted-like homeobox transcription factor [Trema orientale]|uniref:Knotted-like homeobox transcription factor n=1 Tax=Trema orientale TaxID=63057 RepID=A0A2P5BR52_TREOI|nr:Knotted-like homeobox transcription factor [Trema orientale]